MTLPLPLSQIAAIYGVNPTTLHRWGAKGISRENLRNPSIVLEKLRLSATHDSLVLQRLADPVTRQAIATAIENAISQKA